MKKTIILAIAVMAVACTYRSKKNYILSTTANRYNHNNGCPVKLYREYYHAFSGFMTSDLNALYLTDSTSFRINLGLYDTEYERINTTCKGDTLKIEKLTKLGYMLSDKPDSTYISSIQYSKDVETKIYSLKKLKEEGDFDY